MLPRAKKGKTNLANSGVGPTLHIKGLCLDFFNFFSIFCLANSEVGPPLHIPIIDLEGIFERLGSSLYFFSFERLFFLGQWVVVYYCQLFSKVSTLVYFPYQVTRALLFFFSFVPYIRLLPAASSRDYSRDHHRGYFIYFFLFLPHIRLHPAAKSRDYSRPLGVGS